MTHKAAIIGIGVFEVVQEAPFSVEQLSLYLAETLAADQVVIDEIHPLSGGAIQENWHLGLQVAGGAFHGKQVWVLRKDAPSGVSASHERLNMRCYPMRSRTPFLRQSLSAYARIRR